MAFLILAAANRRRHRRLGTVFETLPALDKNCHHNPHQIDGGIPMPTMNVSLSDRLVEFVEGEMLYYLSGIIEDGRDGVIIVRVLHEAMEPARYIARAGLA